jgi:hypothetical protein
MTESREPTERDRFWLDHETAIQSSGQSAKAYAAAHELSLHALYQSRKRLRALGLMARSRSVRSDRKSSPKSVSFSKVELSTRRRPSPDFRLSLPNGLVLEWSGADLPSLVIDLVERLTRPRSEREPICSSDSAGLLSSRGRSRVGRPSRRRAFREGGRGAVEPS